MIEKNILEELYLNQKLSAVEVGKKLNCSDRKVDYWLKKHKIPKRTVSEAIYAKKNPKGDPFRFKNPSNIKEAFLFGLGLGLYWGEGTKSNPTSVRLGNTDPKLIKKFIEFLKETYNIDSGKLKFGLQIFSDMSKNEALNFWIKHLQVDRSQFMKVIVTPARSLGTYRNKTKHGVLTVYFNNKKLRNSLIKAIEKL